MSKLPPNVRPVKDRHGKVRYRFRRNGWASAYLPGKPGTAAFHHAYAEILERGPVVKDPVQSPRKVTPKSLDDLYRRMKMTTRWAKKSARTHYVQTGILDRFLDRVNAKGIRYGDCPATSVSVAWLDAILAQMSGTPAAANDLRKVLTGLMDHACRLGWRVDNPVKLTDRYRAGPGIHDWTDAEIEQYRSHHKLGSMARLTMELALNTAARRCNVNKIERDHIKGGYITVAHVKDNNVATVPMLATTRAALDALPAAPIKYLVTTAFGKPFTDAGLGNRMRKWCNEAGLPHCSIHGLRKAISRKMAEAGATDAQGQAVTGHKKNDTFVYYRAGANRKALATEALSNLSEKIDVQPLGNGDISDA